MDCRPNSGRLRHWSFPSKNAFHSGNKCRPETQQHPLATSSQAQRDKPTKTKSIILEPGATAPGSCRNSQTLDPTLDQKNLALDQTRQLWTPRYKPRQTTTRYPRGQNLEPSSRGGGPDLRAKNYIHLLTLFYTNIYA